MNDAEEVLQNCFIKVFARLDQFKEEGELGGMDQKNYGKYRVKLFKNKSEIPL